MNAGMTIFTIITAQDSARRNILNVTSRAARATCVNAHGDTVYHESEIACKTLRKIRPSRVRRCGT